MKKTLINKSLQEDLEPIINPNDKRYLNAIAVINNEENRTYLKKDDYGKFIFNEVQPNDIIEVSTINVIDCYTKQYYYIVLGIDDDLLLLSRKFENYKEIHFLKHAIITNHLVKHRPKSNYSDEENNY